MTICEIVRLAPPSGTACFPVCCYGVVELRPSGRNIAAKKSVTNQIVLGSMWVYLRASQ